MDPDLRNLLIRCRAVLTTIAAEKRDDDAAELRRGVAARLRADVHAALEAGRVKVLEETAS